MLVWAVSYGEPGEGYILSCIFHKKDLAKQYVENLLNEIGKPFLYEEDSDNYIWYYFNKYFDSKIINPKNCESYVIEPHIVL